MLSVFLYRCVCFFAKFNFLTLVVGSNTDRVQVNKSNRRTDLSIREINGYYMMNYCKLMSQTSLFVQVDYECTSFV